jgi:hypothetical protein
MRPNHTSSQLEPIAGNFVLSDNLALLVPPRQLIQWTFEAVQTFLWSTNTGDTTPTVPGKINPRVLLTLLTYSYATGVFSSPSIAEMCEVDDTFRYLSLGCQFAPDRIRLLRGQNSELVQRCLAFVIRHAYEHQTRESESTLVESASIQKRNLTALYAMAFSQHDAQQRFHRAVKSDWALQSDFFSRDTIEPSRTPPLPTT